jgi:hypothetical protein
MTSVLPMEPIIDRGISKLQKHLFKVAQSGEIVNLNYYFHCWAFEIVGEITVRN